MSTTPIRNARAAALPAKLSRTWLLVNAAKPELFEPGQRSEADSVIFDMEAAVAEDQKDTARAHVVEALSGRDSDTGEPKMTAWVRINGTRTPHWEDDLAALNGLAGLRGVMLPNTEAPEQVSWTSMKAGAGVPVLALVETAIGVEHATQIANAPGTFRLALGTNDLRKDTGMSDDPLALAYVRSRLVIASRVGGLPGAIDGPSPAGASEDRVREDCEWTIKMGMAGKLTLTPSMTPIINDSLAPSEDERRWARELIEGAQSSGGEITDGSYLPRLARAKKIVELADSYGLWNA
ncbi:HpcH/HpaI aldolase/citrate lyase family protein [Brevibacterium yomogidense]|uniref:Citrate lyase beta chain n=1 Tax=Brevibacterium yomogidense TaxID=946573 RepID=A0A1X6XJW3_9MICO|nr:CoA ester lyase [Brevibacterium yomogidense]SLM99433.1 Citrate lyase beta chain [Brevibacterium yomogidense]